MQEIWKEIKNFENYYEISNKGRLRSKDRIIRNGQGNYLKKGQIVKPIKCTNGYLEYALKKNGKYKIFLAHRLIATYFIPNPDNKPEVNHLDEDITNNCVENLEWCTSKENANYGTRNKRCKENNKKQCKPIIQLDLKGNRIKEYKTIGDASREVKGDISAIIRVCKGRQKTAYNYIWQYK